jgi:hypothetical protein
MNKRKPEPGTAEYAPNKVRRQHHSRGKMTRIPAKLQPGATIIADDDIKRIPISELRQEPGAHELATSPDMKPYLEFIKAVIQDHDPSPEPAVIRQLPLEKRYVWRLASALKWGFADCESLSAEADSTERHECSRVFHRPFSNVILNWANILGAQYE